MAIVTTKNAFAQVGGKKFIAKLSSKDEIPSKITKATRTAEFTLSKDEKTITYKVDVKDTDKVTMAHIHQGKQGENGPVVVTLFKANTPTWKVNGHLVNGSISNDILEAPWKSKTLEDLANPMRSGNSYVNVHTTKNPNGEIRGRIFGGG